MCRWPIPFWCHNGGPVSCGPVRKDDRSITSAVIYARVSSARQKKDETIASQTAALRAHAEQQGLEVPDGWVFRRRGALQGHARVPGPGTAARCGRRGRGGRGAVLLPGPAGPQVRLPGLADRGVHPRRDPGGVHQGPRGESPEDQLLVQFQGMFAEYEKAQILERYRRGKTHRAKTGSINVLSGAPFGYRYARKSDHAGASSVRRCWSPNCSAATPTTALPSPT